MYEVLGLTKGASMDEVKKAYKKLALLHHPDKGGNPDEFRKITEAYEKITNPDPVVPNHEFHGFQNFFNQQQTQVVNISLAEVILGGTKTIKIVKSEQCPKCKNKCTTCNGSGQIHQQIHMFMMQHTCPNCLGDGSASTGCVHCCFKKVVETCTIVNLNITPGTQEHNIPFGNIILVIKINSHPDFIRLGNQVLWCPKISFDDSIKGSKLTCPFFNGDFEVDTSLLVPIDPRFEYQSSNVYVKIKFDIQYPNM